MLILGSKQLTEDLRMLERDSSIPTRRRTAEIIDGDATLVRVNVYRRWPHFSLDVLSFSIVWVALRQTDRERFNAMDRDLSRAIIK